MCGRVRAMLVLVFGRESGWAATFDRLTRHVSDTSFGPIRLSIFWPTPVFKAHGNKGDRSSLVSEGGELQQYTFDFDWPKTFSRLLSVAFRAPCPLSFYFLTPAYGVQKRWPHFPRNSISFFFLFCPTDAIGLAPCSSSLCFGTISPTPIFVYILRRMTWTWRKSLKRGELKRGGVGVARLALAAFNIFEEPRKRRKRKEEKTSAGMDVLFTDQMSLASGLYVLSIYWRWLRERPDLTLSFSFTCCSAGFLWRTTALPVTLRAPKSL